MTSSKIRGFQTSSVIFRTFCHTLLDDVIFHHPLPPFSQMISDKIVFYGKITKLGLSDEYYSKQKSFHLLLAKCFRNEITHFNE